MYYQRRVAFYTLGCKLNYAETSSIGRRLQEHGFDQVSSDAIADYYVINTCSVTENADRECRQIVRQALRINGDAKIVVIGCYAQLKPDEIAKIPGVRLVLGANEKFNLHNHLEKLEWSDEPLVMKGTIDEVQHFAPSFSAGERTRVFLKVQDGCDYHCSFCTIPLARGTSRSQSIAKTLQSAEEALSTGVKEIVLTGVNVGDFGKTADGKERTAETFLDLLYRLDALPGIERLRISSIEPNLLTPDIIRFVASSSRFARHFHIPLQSGSDRILKYMRRKYLTALYRERLELIRECMPDAGIGADVIVGFPGERETDFQETVTFISTLPVSYLHVFTYSERENTRALQYDEAVPVAVRKQRNRVLRDLSEQKRVSFYKQMSGTVRPVLWESAEQDGEILGYTDNYIRVSAPAGTRIVNQITPELLGDFSETSTRLRVSHFTSQFV